MLWCFCTTSPSDWILTFLAGSVFNAHIHKIQDVKCTVTIRPASLTTRQSNTLHYTNSIHTKKWRMSSNLKPIATPTVVTGTLPHQEADFHCTDTQYIGLVISTEPVAETVCPALCRLLCYPFLLLFMLAPTTNVKPASSCASVLRKMETGWIPHVISVSDRVAK